MASLKKQAKKLAEKGRYGDRHLLHVSAQELESLAMGGNITRNPKTGLPEAFNLGHWVAEHTPGQMIGHPGLDWYANAPGSPMAVTNAINRNSWGAGGGVTGNQNTHTGWDDLMGGWGAEYPGMRRIGRGVGLAFGGYAAGSALGLGASTGAEAEAAAPGAEASSSGPGLYGSGVDEFGNPVSGPGSYDTPSGAPTGSGGSDFPASAFPMTEVGSSSAAWPAISTAGRALGIGSSVYGLYQAEQARRERNRQLRQRQQYQDQLNELMAHPDRVTQLPGYKFRQQQGEEAVARRMASLGYGAGSGNLGTSLVRYGQDYATGELERQEGLLAKYYDMSGPSINIRDPYDMASRSLASLGYGVGRF